MEANKCGKIELPKPKSDLIIGNVIVKNTKHFNWFNKLMFKWAFGIEIRDIEEREEN